MIALETPATARRRHKGHFERGAAAVEMALVLPVLLFLLMAMIDFGRAYNAQIQLSAAAREGVRLASLNGTAVPTLPIDQNPTGTAAIVARVSSAAGGMPAFTASCAGPTIGAPSTVCITYCAPAASQATVVVMSSFTWITGISGMSRFFGSGTFPTPSTVQATGVMRCMG